MSGQTVLARLEAAGAEVILRDGAPAVRSPRPLPLELLAAARAHKPELAALLAERAHRNMAAALLAVAKRGAAAVAAGPVDDIEAAEAEAIRVLAEQPRRNLPIGTGRIFNG